MPRCPGSQCALAWESGMDVLNTLASCDNWPNSRSSSAPFFKRALDPDQGYCQRQGSPPLQLPPINYLGEGGSPVPLTAVNLWSHAPGTAPKSKTTGPHGLPGPLVFALCDATSWKYDIQCSISFRWPFRCPHVFHLTDPWDSEATESNAVSSAGTPLSN